MIYHLEYCHCHKSIISLNRQNGNGKALSADFSSIAQPCGLKPTPFFMLEYQFRLYQKIEWRSSVSDILQSQAYVEKPPTSSLP